MKCAIPATKTSKKPPKSADSIGQGDVDGLPYRLHLDDARLVFIRGGAYREVQLQDFAAAWVKSIAEPSKDKNASAYIQGLGDWKQKFADIHSGEVDGKAAAISVNENHSAFKLSYDGEVYVMAAEELAKGICNAK